VSDLDEKLGNLCGQLSRLVPAVEKVGDRLDAVKDRVLISEMAIEEVKNDVDRLKRQKRSESERRWDVTKIIFQIISSAVVAAFVAWLMR